MIPIIYFTIQCLFVPNHDGRLAADSRKLSLGGVSGQDPTLFHIVVIHWDAGSEAAEYRELDAQRGHGDAQSECSWVETCNYGDFSFV